MYDFSIDMRTKITQMAGLHPDPHAHGCVTLRAPTLIQARALLLETALLFFSKDVTLCTYFYWRLRFYWRSTPCMVSMVPGLVMCKDRTWGQGSRALCSCPTMQHLKNRSDTSGCNLPGIASQFAAHRSGVCWTVLPSPLSITLKYFMTAYYIFLSNLHVCLCLSVAHPNAIWCSADGLGLLSLTRWLWIPSSEGALEEAERQCLRSKPHLRCCSSLSFSSVGLG